MIDFVCRQNVEWEFYRASLNGEITREEFFKAREIIKRATQRTSDEIQQFEQETIAN